MMEQQTLQLQTIRLYSVWLKFLNHAGKYAARYYMARDLELPPEEQDPSSKVAMLRYYGTKKKLDGAIQSDLDKLPLELLEVREAQIACGLKAFSDRHDYLMRIITGLTMIDYHGDKRRQSYTGKIRYLQKKLNAGKAVEPLSLNELEEHYQNCRRKAEKRAAEKAAQIEQDAQDVREAMKAAYDATTNTVHLPE